MTGADAIAILILLTIVIAIGVYLLHWLYRHSSKNRSFVRTGVGGERVVMGGGAFVLPIIHDVTVVNMNAVPIEIRRANENSLLTKNKMRIDVVAEFDVRVIPTEEGVSTAARSLGERTANTAALQEVIQGRFVDAMSAVAARHAMEEIHTNRIDYMKEVTSLVEETLEKHGLELENASLTSLNQSDIKVFDPRNAFDAEGLTQLTEQVEAGRRRRNEIENEARVAIRIRDYEAEQRSLEIDRDLEYARLEQSRDIERRRSQQQAEIEEERANSEVSIQTSKTRAEQEAERIRIDKERAVNEERINSENRVRALEIQRREENEVQASNAERALEAQRIVNQQAIEAERIDNERKTRVSEIESRHDVAIRQAKADAEIDTTRSEKARETEESRIATTNAIEMLSVDKARELKIATERASTEEHLAAIARHSAVDQQRIQHEEDVAQRRIGKEHAVKLAETSSMRETQDANIAAQREIEEMRVAAQKFIERFEIEQQKEVELVDKDRLIAVINKSIEEAVARTDEARQQQQYAKAEEEVSSARALEVADRNKQVEQLEASSRAEREALRITRQAEAERAAAEERAQAEIAEANAAEVRYDKDAQGARKLNESENMRNEQSRRSAIYEHLVKTLPDIIEQTVKPMENIDSIKIMQVDGLPGINSPSESSEHSDGSGGSGGGNMTDRVVNSAMKYRTQVAFVDGLMKDLGLPLDSIGSAGGMSFRNFAESDKEEGSDN